MQDRGQKSQALQYSISKRWFPQLELVVCPKIGTANKNKPLTDIDVLSLVPDEFEAFRTVLIDCKTGKNESPITRALWLRGLMDQLGATRGIIILKKKSIEDDHRYTAAKFDVILLAESEFDEFQSATRGVVSPFSSNASNIDLWDEYLSISKRFSTLANVCEFVFSGFWMCQSPSEACRKTISVLKAAKGELNPEITQHMLLVGDLCALFMVSVSRLTASVFTAYLKPDDRDKLSSALLLLLYGGREAYDYRNKIWELVQKKNSGDLTDEFSDKSFPSLAPPKWDKFLELVRSCLETPIETAKAPLLLREIAFSKLTLVNELKFAETLAKESPHAARLAISGIDYLCKAAQLPPEFDERFVNILMEIQST